MNRDHIKAVLLANGFKEKPQADGQLDLNPYVYEAVEALLGEPIGWLSPNGVWHSKYDYNLLLRSYDEFAECEIVWFKQFIPLYAPSAMIASPAANPEAVPHEQGKF